MAAAKKGDYEIVVGKDEVDLIREVNLQIKKGWSPLGGPSVFQRDDGKWAMLQAVVKS